MNKIIKSFQSKNTRAIFLIFLAAAGIIMIILSYFSGKTENGKINSSSVTNDESLYQAMIEKRLHDTINSITGQNCKSVMITLEGGFENVYDTANYTSDDGLFSKAQNNPPPVIKTKNPKIAGVMIVCSDIFDAQSISEIKKAAATCLNINENKIYIIGGTITQ